jgi:NTP pyrophosphatase (non-canonical NTP hydrolase)
MNEFFGSLGKRWQKAAERRGVKIEEPTLDPKIAEELLELARVVSHSKERRFAPLATYTAGIAVERLREAKPDEAGAIAALIREVREELEREPPAGSP